MHIVDRRQNPRGKSLGNRQRFIRKHKSEIAEQIKKIVGDSSIKGVEKRDVKIKPTHEPTFRQDRSTGSRDFVYTGNEEYQAGDLISKPQGGTGGRGNKAGQGQGEDDYVFTLTREEMLEFLFDDFKLPDLVKRTLASTKEHKLQRAGFSPEGSPSRLNVVKTLGRSLARRIALRRPKQEEIDAAEAKAKGFAEDDQSEAAKQARLHLEELKTRSKAVAYIDPIDQRFNRFEKVPKPVSQAVMFCLMDASGSMTEELKDMGKRFWGWPR